jgi:feruloyl esterase
MMATHLVRLFVVGVTVAVRLASALGNKTAAQRCIAGTFIPWLPDNVSVEKATLVLDGDTYGEGTLDLMYPTQPTDLPELCAVTIYVQSSAISSYRFGLFLPTDWNQRYLAIGNGGFGGGINWLDMGPGSKYGFAVVSTDTGHNSTTGDASWAYLNPEKQADWGWRATNGSVTIAKGLAEVYYAQKVQYSYYNGCSNGGRQGLKQVQITPDMFDGVIVGAAAWYTTHLNPWMTAAGIANVNVTSPKRIDWHLFPAMGDLVISQCDALDGVVDGIVSFFPATFSVCSTITNLIDRFPLRTSVTQITGQWPAIYLGPTHPRA